jgi:hypothetical protein
MPDPLTAAERYRKEAADFSELAKSAETAFVRDYYARLAQRYLMHAEDQEKLARMSEGFATGQHQDAQIAHSPGIRATPEAFLPEQASDQSTAQPAQGARGARRRVRRRRSVHGPHRPGGQGWKVATRRRPLLMGHAVDFLPRQSFRLFEALALARGDGRCARLLEMLSKIEKRRLWRVL